MIDFNHRFGILTDHDLPNLAVGFHFVGNHDILAEHIVPYHICANHSALEISLINDVTLTLQCEGQSSYLIPRNLSKNSLA